MPVMVPAINKLAQTLQQTAKFFNEHPTITKVGVSLVAAASGALLLGGAANILSAGFGGLKLVFAPLMQFVAQRGSMAAAGTAIQFLSKFLGPVGIGVAALGVAFVAWNKVLEPFIHKHAPFFTHVLAEAERMLKKCGLAIQGFGNQIACILDVLSQTDFGKWVKNAKDFYGAEIDAVSKQIQTGIEKATRVSKDQQARDLRTVGAPVASFIKGAPVAVPQGAGPATHIGTVNMNVQPVPGHDHKKCAEHMMHELTKKVHQSGSARSFCQKLCFE